MSEPLMMFGILALVALSRSCSHTTTATTVVHYRRIFLRILHRRVSRLQGRTNRSEVRLDRIEAALPTFVIRRELDDRIASYGRRRMNSARRSALIGTIIGALIGIAFGVGFWALEPTMNIIGSTTVTKDIVDDVPMIAFVGTLLTSLMAAMGAILGFFVAFFREN